MHYSRHLCESPVNGGSARLSRATTTSLAPQSPRHAPHSSTIEPLTHDLSHLALSEPGGSTIPSFTSRIPILDLPKPGQPLIPGLQLPLQGYGFGKLSSHAREEKPRCDSVQPSSTCSESGSTSGITQPYPVISRKSTAKQNRSLSSACGKTRNDENKVQRQPGEDIVPRKETPTESRTLRVRPKITTQLSTNSISALPVEVRNPERNVRSLLEPQYPRSPALSTHSSVEIISDGGDQRHLRHEIDCVSDCESQDVASPDADEDPSLAASMASLPLQSQDHNLVNEVMKARLPAQNGEGHSAWFIPKKELRRVINRDAVRDELSKQVDASKTSPRKDAQIRSYANRVCQDIHTEEQLHGKTKIKTFRKVFALLVLVESSYSIIQCLHDDHGVSDQDLPLRLHRHQNNLPELFRRGDRHQKSIDCFKNWSSIKLENFYKFQWWFLAPFFSPDEDGIVKHYILHDEHILPYIPPEPHEEWPVDKIGGYGEVRMVKIHPDHHEFRDQLLCDRGFAIKKQIQDDNRDMFKREAEILRKFSGARSHPHVVSLLATYEQFRKLHLVFYRAQGNLIEYWNNVVPDPEFTQGNVLWFATQCKGIADGLSKLHKLLSFSGRSNQKEEHSDTKAGTSTRRVAFKFPPQRVGTDSSVMSNGVKLRPTSPIVATDCDGMSLIDDTYFGTPGHDSSRKKYGRHGDITPMNILWYHDSEALEQSLMGTLKLADFGQAEINTEYSKTRQRDVANTLTYRPPECDTQPSTIRQSYDIWSLGCVYLEFISWLLGGNSLTRSFSLKRNTPDVFLGNAPSDTFFEVIRHAPSDEEEFRIKPAVVKSINEMHSHKNCTMFIHEFLDLVQGHMLVIDSKDRSSCTHIVRKLKTMLEKCQDDTDYAVSAIPWCVRQPQNSRAVRLRMTPDAEKKIEENLPRQTRASSRIETATTVQPISRRRVPASRIPRPSARLN